MKMACVAPVSKRAELVIRTLACRTVSSDKLLKNVVILTASTNCVDGGRNSLVY